MPVDFCRHLVGKTLRNVCHCDSAQICFVSKSLIIYRLRNDLYCVEWGVKLYSIHPFII